MARSRRRLQSTVLLTESGGFETAAHPETLDRLDEVVLGQVNRWARLRHDDTPDRPGAPSA